MKKCRWWGGERASILGHMTPQHQPPAAPASHSIGDERPAITSVRLTHVSDLLGALPALLGFYPEESIVVMCMGGPRRTEFTGFIRADFPTSVDGSPSEQPLQEAVSSFREFCTRNGVDAVLLALISAADQVQLAEAADYVAQALEASEISVGAIYLAPAIGAGERWVAHYPAYDEGVITDPRESEVAAELVAAGRLIRRSRADIFADLAVADAEQTRRIGRMLRFLAPETRREPSALDAHRLERVISQVTAIDEGKVLNEVEYAELGQALLRIPVRDCLFTLALTDVASSAEHLWTDLTRRLPAPARTEAAALLGFSAYVHGEGVLAGAALDIALGDDPEHAMASMLDQALRSGLPPHHVAEIATMGWELAAMLGAALPEPSLRARSLIDREAEL